MRDVAHSLTKTCQAPNGEKNNATLLEISTRLPAIRFSRGRAGFVTGDHDGVIALDLPVTYAHANELSQAGW